MASNKKPKKKYVPRDIRYPSLVTQMNSFLPFEKALDRLLETGEVDVDSEGIFIFKDGAGNDQSFVSSLKVYIEIISIYCKQNNIEYDIYPLHILQNRMFEAMHFDEEEIEEARKCLTICKEIIVKIKPALLLNILDTVRIAMAQEKAADRSLKDPEMYLYALKHKAGELTYEDVCSRYKQYQELALENPNDSHILKLRDFYVEFYSAYNFYRQKKLSEV